MTDATAAPRRHNEPLLAAAQEGRFVVQRCPSCGHVPNYPRVACPHCFAELEWFEPPARGTVASFTIIHRPEKGRFDGYIPIVMALIRLEEDAELISTVVGEDRLDVAVGASVEFAPDGWSRLPQFRLARDR